MDNKNKATLVKIAFSNQDLGGKTVASLIESALCEEPLLDVIKERDPLTTYIFNSIVDADEEDDAEINIAYGIDQLKRALRALENNRA